MHKLLHLRSLTDQVRCSPCNHQLGAQTACGKLNQVIGHSTARYYPTLASCMPGLAIQAFIAEPRLLAQRKSTITRWLHDSGKAGVHNESQVAKGHIKAASLSVSKSFKFISTDLMLSLQVMVLGGTHNDIQATVSHGRRSKRHQIRAFDHYSNGGGTWVCLYCFLPHTYYFEQDTHA
jgi:hypothetical protein